MKHSVMSLWTWTLSLCVLCLGCSDEKKPPGKQAGVGPALGECCAAEKTSQHTSPEQAAKTPQPQVDAATAKTATQADDPQSLEALKKLGVSLKTDKDGLVVEANVRGAVVDDSALDSLGRLAAS